MIQEVPQATGPTAWLKLTPAAVLAVGLLVGAPLASAGPYDMRLQPVPSAPSIYQPTNLDLEGSWLAGCYPQFGGVVVDGGSIDIYFLDPSQFPDEACLSEVAPWRGKVTLGLLAPGDYTATARMTQSLPPSPESSVTVGLVEFGVLDRVGVELHGLVPRSVVCVNRTTQQRVAVPQKRGPLNCESAGLIVQPGDRVAIRIRGYTP